MRETIQSAQFPSGNFVTATVPVIDNWWFSSALYQMLTLVLIMTVMSMMIPMVRSMK